MKKYLGTKLILAQPMTRKAYNDYRGWQLPEDEKHLANEAGFLVEYVDGGRANDERHAGYISWSPADVFAKAYREIDKLTFGEALEAMRQGHSVCRQGWNGKGMFIYLVPENRYKPTTEAGRAIGAKYLDGMVPYGAYIAIKTAQDNVVPWLASQTDVLAQDWEVLS